MSVLWMVLCFLVLFHAQRGDALYEDQVGKFDWHQKYLGQVIEATFDQNGRRLLVASAENVLAAIGSKTGQIEWRQVFEKGPTANVDDMLMIGQNVVLTLGGGTYIRCFSPVLGDLLWENNMKNANPKKRSQLAPLGGDNVLVTGGGQVAMYDLQSGSEQWTKALPESDAYFVSGGGEDEEITVLSVTFGVGVGVNAYDETGAQTQSLTASAGWITSQTSCVLSPGHFTCVEGGNIYILQLSKPQSFTKHTLQDLGLSSNVASVETISSTPSSIIGVRLGQSNMAAVEITKGQAKVIQTFPQAACVEAMTYSDKLVLVAAQVDSNSESLELRAYDISTRNEISELRQTYGYGSDHGLPGRLMSHTYRRRGDGGSGGMGIRSLVFGGVDESMVMVQQGGRIAWTREEALAHILAVEMVDLPVSPILAKMEEEFGGGGGPDNIFEMFIKRLTTQLAQLKDVILSVRHRLRLPRQHGVHMDDDADNDLIAAEGEDEEEDEEDLTRDFFNLHKMIVATTASGKLFGMDSNTGRLVWKRLVPRLVPFSRTGKFNLPVYVLRTTAHFPLTPYCTVVGQNRVTGDGMIFSFNPITGETIMEEETSVAGLQQVYQIAQLDDNFIKPLVLLSQDRKFHVLPASDLEFVTSLATSLYIFTTDLEEGKLQGYSMRVKERDLLAEPTWNVNLQHEGQMITLVQTKRAAEHVHSQGVVLGDRSVLYKYINPNLVVVATENVASENVALYLIDAVTGHMVFHCIHKKARGPVNIVHSENWIVYNYWNIKKWRTEMGVIELYEGSKQSNSTAFSSLSPPPAPLVMRQAFIFGSHIAAMASTLTERGLTNKQVIMALENGGVLGMPKMMLDARRPIVPTAEHKEEGIMPYIPELPRPYEAIINYNQTIHNIRGIHTGSAGLESTSLILCYGLDIFFTRVTPSKLFDVLNDDFDYLFIGSVTAGMIAISVISRKLAARKALNRAWK